MDPSTGTSTPHPSKTNCTPDSYHRISLTLEHTSRSGITAVPRGVRKVEVLSLIFKLCHVPRTIISRPSLTRLVHIIAGA